MHLKQCKSLFKIKLTYLENIFAFLIHQVHVQLIWFYLKLKTTEWNFAN